jgi:hypothetical protein
MTHRNLTRGGFLGIWLIVMGGCTLLVYQKVGEFLRDRSFADIGSPPLTRVSATSIDPHSSSKALSQNESAGGVRNRNENFVVGIMFANQPRYIKSLLAQSETWLATFPKDRVFAVGPDVSINSDPVFPRVVPTPCPDRELWCKRLKQITEAFRLLKSGITFDWLLSGNEDWYVHIPAMRRSLLGKDADEPVVYASLGCSQEWQYHKDSKGGTVPEPPGWPRGIGCDTLRKRGGTCLGDGAVFSRAAIEIMMEDGEDGLFNLTRSQPFEWNTHPQDDPVLSCVVYAFGDKGVKLALKPWEAQYFYKQDGTMRVNEQSATVHAVPREGMDAADIIREVHLAFSGKKDKA